MGLNERRRKSGGQRICSERSPCTAASTAGPGPSTAGGPEGTSPSKALPVARGYLLVVPLTSAPEELPFPFFDSWPSTHRLAAQGLACLSSSSRAPGCWGGRGWLVTGVFHPPSRPRGNGGMAEPAGRAQGPVSPWGHRCCPGGSP